MRVVDLWTVQIIDELDDPPTYDSVQAGKFLDEMEENLTDLLPAGYRARIRRWDDLTDEPTQEDQDA